MKKLVLFLSMSLILGTLSACTTEKNTRDASTTKQEDVKQNSSKVVYEIPNDSWDLSPTFEHSVVYKDGRKFTYKIVGDNKTVGFTGQTPLVAKENNKHMWFYFGFSNIYNKPIEVKAVKQGTEELVDLHSGYFYKDAEVSADSVNMPSNLQFPSSGLWKILIYLNGKHYKSIVVEVV